MKKRRNRYKLEALIMLSVLPFIVLVGIIFAALIIFGYWPIRH